ncbi:hypothetical protein [Nitratireductor alexandrii]|uniref:hypothetical protein n=1 Tax=Nitratireductor alexandrii TaxID=2448161 RepID=UPI000FD9F753|nr:hypothetical protein [Nitratireductor alexandrii]
MQFLAEVPFASDQPQLTLDLKDALRGGGLKFVGEGELSAQKTDRRLYIQANSKSAGYKNYVRYAGSSAILDGDTNDGRGFYVGRNGWHEDATFSFEYTISFYATGQRLVGLGGATFAQASHLFGSECHGALDSNEPLRSVRVAFDGGLVRGAVRIYKI